MANQGNIVVDVGNSFIKSAKFDGDRLIEKKTWSELAAIRTQYDNPKFKWIFSSVSRKESEIERLFSDVDYMLLTQDTPVPVRLDYSTPDTLGMDRLAAAIGAYHVRPEVASLVIDAGSCITYDIMDAGIYRGGVIAPGLKMRMRAMHHFTSRLPDISDEWLQIEKKMTGKSTKECLVNGAFTGMIHEINGFIEQYMKEYPDLAVILTGGDAVHFESSIKAPIFADFNLVLIGLNRILNHNQ